MKNTPNLKFRSKTVKCLASLHHALTCMCHWTGTTLYSFLRALLLRVDPFWLQLCYFVTLFMLGYMSLSILEPRSPMNRPKSYDLLFTAVSAVTVSSMATVEMEIFKLSERKSASSPSSNMNVENGLMSTNSNIDLKYKSMKFLGITVLCYFFTVQVIGYLLVSLYVGLVVSIKEVLMNKKLNLQVFSIVTTISTFTNCGFLPTNENMMVFKNNQGLQVILIPLVLLGNTLYPVFLRLVLLLLGKISVREEIKYVLENEDELRYPHLLSGVDSWYLSLTSVGFTLIQFVLLMSIGWKSQAMHGLNTSEKVVGSLFQVTNTRHTGESVFDLSLVSPAIIVLIVTMM
ncbi:unnamed protein product [Lactuca saligna]|uniref:Uncharacterized protein n=1 Tax=Lactuca saligna TaxID=75948 RepID=A0AA35ZKJ0_LACSI|nr:unnamed protein product [Lactuca saligna]